MSKNQNIHGTCTIYVRVPPELFSRLNTAVKKEERTQTEIVQRALNEYLAIHGQDRT